VEGDKSPYMSPEAKVLNFSGQKVIPETSLENVRLLLAIISFQKL